MPDPQPSLTAEGEIPSDRYGTALDPEGFDLLEAVERHERRPGHKSHPNHCAHCYYPWPCPTVVLYRRNLNLRAAALKRDGYL